MAASAGQGSVPKKRGKAMGSLSLKKTEGRGTKSLPSGHQNKSNGVKKKSEGKDSPKSRDRKKTGVETANKGVKNSPTPLASGRKNGTEPLKSIDIHEELIVVAGKEICGRKVSLWDEGSSTWRNADVVRFKPSLSQHLIRYLDRSGDSVKHEERWVDLSKHRFQFLLPPPPDALPNPSYRKAPKRKAAVGYKVRVFWTMMGKWYLGKVLDYDVESKTHTVRYKDGDEQKLSLRHEAVVYLSPGSPTADSGNHGKTKLINGSKEGEKIGKSPKASKGQVTKKDEVEKRKATTGKVDEQQVKKKQKSVENQTEKERQIGASIIGSRLAIYTEKSGCFQKGIVDKFKQEGSQHCILFENGDMELLNLSRLEFRYLSPKTRSGGCTDAFLTAMENFGAEQTKAVEAIHHSSGFCGSNKPAETISRRAPVKEACVYWRLSIRGADKKWYLGEVIAYHAASDKHVVLYDDGEHEVLHLPSELIAWHCYTKDGKKIVFPGRPKPTDKKNQENIVGWRVAVYWPAERDFFRGKVAQYNTSLKAFEVNYDDGDHSTIRLGEDKIKWIFPPGTYYNSKPFLYRTDVQIISEGKEKLEEESDIYSGKGAKSIGRGRPKNSRNKPKTPRSHGLFHQQKPGGVSDSMYARSRFSSKARQVFDIEPTFVRSISSSPVFPGLQSNKVPPRQQTAIAVRVYLSEPPRVTEQKESSDINNLEEMIRRVRRAEESLLKGIPTYLPTSLHDARGGHKRWSGAMGAISSKMVVHRKLQAQHIFMDDDSESDNLNNSTANALPRFSRFRKPEYVSVAANLPRLPLESSSASSSDDEGDQSDALEDYDLFVSPATGPTTNGGKVKPNISFAYKNVETTEAIFNPADEPVSPDAPQPIESPFGDQAGHVNPDETPLDIDPVSDPMGGVGYHSESVGNLLGMSRNSSEAMLLGNDFQIETLHE